MMAPDAQNLSSMPSNEPEEIKERPILVSTVIINALLIQPRMICSVRREVQVVFAAGMRILRLPVAGNVNQLG